MLNLGTILTGDVEINMNELCIFCGNRAIRNSWYCSDHKEQANVYVVVRLIKEIEYLHQKIYELEKIIKERYDSDSDVWMYW